MNYTSEQANILVQALPYIQQYYGKTIVIKYGGNAMIDDALKASVLRDIVLLRFVGMNPILVHGGGPEINQMMKRVGKEPTFIGGLRVTDEETMEIVEMVLAGKTNKGIVSIINTLGGQAVGLSGKDAKLIEAEQKDAALGFVGSVTNINPEILHTLANQGYIPVISSVAIGPNGESLNVNADHIAGAIAAAIGATKLLMLTDVTGIFEDKDDPSTLKSVLSKEEALGMIKSGKIDKGMIPKVEACITALDGGVERTHIINGTLPHAVLMEIFTDTGIGTMIESS
ncbi:MAG TPA: acetylglutamate kinase [Armatimonadota bacterium]|nr:acetylglutamate kinase [Armatimonadota bacterium]HPP74720.1 acetylglutamate kinase [Armatimonadota bacterium]